jgi:hypothetical protein
MHHKAAAPPPVKKHRAFFNPDVKHFTRLPLLARASMAAAADLAPATCH